MSGIKKSSGNVFRDIGFSANEAEDLRLRSDLLIQLQERIARLRRPQTVVAHRLGISQPRVSDLLTGKIDRFSLDTLALFLRKLGAEVNIIVETPDEFTKLLRDLAETTSAPAHSTWKVSVSADRIVSRTGAEAVRAACATQLAIAA